jgi:hypothetical protein
MRITPSFQKGIVGSVLLLLTVTTKAGLPEPYASWDLIAQHDATQSNASGHTFVSSNLVDGTGSGAVTLVLGLEPTVNATSTALGDSRGETGGDADASAVYGFYVVYTGNGTPPDSAVPIIVSATGTASWLGTGPNILGGSALAQASWGSLIASGEIITSPEYILGTVVASLSEGDFDSFNVNSSNDVPVSTGSSLVPYGVYMNTETSAGADAAGASVSATAFVRSQVTIPSSFPRAGDYQIIYAAGVLAPPKAPPQNQITIPLVSSAANLLYSGIPGRQYVVQWESSANGPWNDLSGILTADPAGLVSFIDCRTPLPSSAIYRVRGYTPP